VLVTACLIFLAVVGRIFGIAASCSLPALGPFLRQLSQKRYLFAVKRIRPPGFTAAIPVPIACLRGGPADISVHNGGVTACDPVSCAHRKAKSSSNVPIAQSMREVLIDAQNLVND
jgi:hypothetical protein